MKFMTDEFGYEMIPVVSAMRRDGQSWLDWSCVRVTARKGIPVHVWGDVCRCLAGTIGERNGCTYLYHSDEIAVLCKDVHPSAMRGIGDYLVQLLDMYGISARSVFYDMKNDSRAFVESFSLKRPVLQYRRTPSPETARPSVAAEQDKALKTCRALLVEDDAVTRWLVRRALKNECALSTAHGVHAAVSSYMTCRPDIVFLDLNLPDGSGREAMEQILKRDPGAYIVIFSSHDSLDNITTSFDEGARGFVAKPFSRDSLIRHLKKVSEDS